MPTLAWACLSNTKNCPPPARERQSSRRVSVRMPTQAWAWHRALAVSGCDSRYSAVSILGLLHLTRGRRQLTRLSRFEEVPLIARARLRRGQRVRRRGALAEAPLR